MSTAESTKDSQTPMQEALDRAAESFPAHLMPRLVGVEHLRNMLGAARKRVNDSHQMQMKTLAQTMGHEIAEQEAAAATEGDEMGGINVRGDTHINITSPAETAKPVASKALGWGTKLLVGAALCGGGAGIGYIVRDLLKPQPAAQQPAAPNTDTDTDTVMVIDFP